MTPSRPESRVTTQQYDPAVPSVIPMLQQPSLNRSVLKGDSQPTRLNVSTPDCHVSTCLVCNTNESRYTCPRCEIPYCSLGCYKRHDSGGTTSCTEAFYQNRVSSVLHMEQRDRSGEMKSILQRSHDSQTAEESPIMHPEALGEGVLSDDELWAISDALDVGLNLDNDADLKDLLSPRVRKAFVQAMESGDLSKVIEQWQPWWTTELVSLRDVDVRSEEEDSSAIGRRTLDERLLKVPSFNVLRPGMKPSPLLACNLVELLYCIATTLRLYHGVRNAVASSREAATTILSSSAVLSNDVRYESVAEAMVACTAASTKALSSDGDCNTHWTVLAGDTSLIIRNRRHIAHALFDAIDIVAASGRASKDAGETTIASELRLVKKKLEFYLSWSRDTDMLSDMEEHVQFWIEQWKHADADDQPTRSGLLEESKWQVTDERAVSSFATTRGVNRPPNTSEPLIREKNRFS